MEVQLIYKNNSFVYNVSPLMPISYLRKLSHKSFNIPEEFIHLSYQNNNIEKEFNETLLKEFFKKSSRITINVTDFEQKNLIKSLFNSTIESSTIKSYKLSKLIQDERKSIKKSFDIYRDHQEIEFSKEENMMKKDKCQNCKKNNIDFYCRDDCKFICQSCKNLHHLNHRIIPLENGNIEQCIYFYQKELIKDIQNQEDEIKILNEKSGIDRIIEKIEEVYDIISKISDLEREIMELFPCKLIDSINNNDYNEIRKNIFLISENCNFKKNSNPYSFKDKISFFKELKNEDEKMEDLKKDIESIKKKYDFEDMLLEFLNQISNNFNYLFTNLNEMWNENKNNLSEFTKEIEEFIKEITKKIKNMSINNENEESGFFDLEIDEIIKECKERNKTHKISNIVLPKLQVRNRNNDENNPTYNSLNLERKKKYILNTHNNNNESLNESMSSNNSLKIIDSHNKKKNTNYKNSFTRKKKSSLLNIKDINLNQYLLSEETKKGPKRPRKRSSTRMSIFTKNMNKVENLSNSIMKVKKKKKKYM